MAAASVVRAVAGHGDQGSRTAATTPRSRPDGSRRSLTTREVRIGRGLAAVAASSEDEAIPSPKVPGDGAAGAVSQGRRGSADRAKARHRVAVLHRKVRDTRLEHAHKVVLRPGVASIVEG